MAKFRGNHSNTTKKGGSFILKIIIYGVVLIYLLWQLLQYFIKYTNPTTSNNTSIQNVPEIQGSAEENKTYDWKIDLPSQSSTSSLIHHSHFSLSYAEPHEQAEWVFYELTREELNAPKVGRFDYFAPDIKVQSRSALHRDYTGSGYTRGHLAPAADMAFDQKAAEESFYMSNISPQKKYLNQGIWRELEESVRDFARRYHSLLIVTGPVLKQNIIKKIGDSRVSVPSVYYKVLLDTVGKEKHGVGFLIPNEISIKPLEEYMVTIDSVEAMTGIDFFNNSSKSSHIEALEKNFDKSKWSFNVERYKKRLDEWNRN